MASGECVGVLRGHVDEVLRVAWAPRAVCEVAAAPLLATAGARRAAPARTIGFARVALCVGCSHTMERVSGKATVTLEFVGRIRTRRCLETRERLESCEFRERNATRVLCGKRRPTARSNSGAARASVQRFLECLENAFSRTERAGTRASLSLKNTLDALESALKNEARTRASRHTLLIVTTSVDWRLVDLECGYGRIPSRSRRRGRRPATKDHRWLLRAACTGAKDHGIL